MEEILTTNMFLNNTCLLNPKDLGLYYLSSHTEIGPNLALEVEDRVSLVPRPRKRVLR